MFNKEKSYFKDKLTAVQRMIWDLEFKRFKSLEVREISRKQYDNLNAKLHAIPKEEDIKDEAEKGKIKDQRAILERDIENYKGQMNLIDLEVNGSKPTNQYPEGYTGISDQLEALRELQGMVKNYIKKL